MVASKERCESFECRWLGATVLSKLEQVRDQLCCWCVELGKGNRMVQQINCQFGLQSFGLMVQTNQPTNQPIRTSQSTYPLIHACIAPWINGSYRCICVLFQFSKDRQTLLQELIDQALQFLLVIGISTIEQVILFNYMHRWLETAVATSACLHKHTVGNAVDELLL
jgi:hypothetical protein